MQADPERQALIVRGLCPAGDKVFLRAHPHTVPRLICAIPQVEIIVVIGQRHKVLCAGAFVERDQFFRVKLLRLPRMNDFLEAGLRWRPVVRQLIRILRVPLDIHIARIPVAVFRLALRSPMRPDAKLGVTKPIRHLILLERVPGRLKFARRNRFRRRIDNHFGNSGLRNGIPRQQSAGSIKHH